MYRTARKHYGAGTPTMELYRKEQNKWVYAALEANDEIDLACLDVHFPVMDAYEGINPKEDFSSGEDI